LGQQEEEDNADGEKNGRFTFVAQAATLGVSPEQLRTTLSQNEGGPALYAGEL